jgi:hypothetical protein
VLVAHIGGKEDSENTEMQKKKNIMLMVSLVVLLGITGVLLWTGERSGTLEVDENLFRVDATKINKVTLESVRDTVDLSFDGSKWMLNGQFAVDPNMIDVLFATIQQAIPRKPVAAALADSISASLQTEGVKVSLFVDGAPAKIFYAGGNSSKTNAYFQLPDGLPYSVVIPGYRVYTSGIFELKESGWKQKYVFGFNWRNFQRLEAEFPANHAFDFKVLMSKEYFGLEGVAKVDTAKLNTFLDQVSLLTVDQYEDDKKITDSLSELRPSMVIKVFDIAKREFSLYIYAPAKPGSDVYGVVGEKQAAVFNFQKISPLIRPKEFFIGH